MARTKFNEFKEISNATRDAVMNRQHSCSISGAGLGANPSFHHVVPRSASGVGFEWNIVALTFDEHRAYHDHQPIKVNGRVRYTWEEFDTLIRNHLKLRYRNWSEDRCKYHKYWSYEDYGIVREDQ